LFAATVTLAWATWQLVKSAEKTAERQLRAYVVVTCKDLIFQGSSHERFIVRLEVRNTGQTPAYRLQIRSVTNAIAYPVQASFDFPLEQLSAEPSIFTLGAGLAIDHNSMATRVLDQNEIVKIKSTDGERSLYNYGIVKYVDAIGKERQTKFCYFFKFRNELKDGQILTSSTGYPSRYHNEAS
jgi:hypothetical protein